MSEAAWQKAESNIEGHLKNNHEDMQPVFHELDGLKQVENDPVKLGQDLKDVNKRLHDQGFLTRMELAQDGDHWSVSPDNKPCTPGDVPPRPDQVQGQGAGSHDAPKAEKKDDPKKAGNPTGAQPPSLDSLVPTAEQCKLPDPAQEQQCKISDPAQQDALISKALQAVQQFRKDPAFNGDTPQNHEDVRAMIEHESTWRPKVINDWDINAVNGVPSKGLIQAIEPTFKANALPGLDKDLTDPLSNVAAGINYALNRYPKEDPQSKADLENVPGIEAMRNGGQYQGY